jgi:AraC-like DNA-binding protein
MDKDTVSIHFVSAAVARLSANTRRRVLVDSGIAPEWLDEPKARVPAQAFSALWLAVAQEIDDEFFGLDRRRMKVGSFALLCHAMLPCETLGHAVRQMLRGFATFFDDVQATLDLDGADAVITIDNRISEPDARRFADETLLVMVHGLMCWLAGRRISLRVAEFAYPRPAYAGEYVTMFCKQLRFDAVTTSVRFDSQTLAVAPVQNAATLKTFLRTAPQSVFLKYRNEAGWAARIRRRMRRSVGQPSWPVLEELAHEFHMAPTTLRRRLEAEGTSVQEIKDKLRRDIAIHHLCSTELGIAGIGSLLGFQEPSAFYRAFKRWSGVRPGEYRERRTSAGA